MFPHCLLSSDSFPPASEDTLLQVHQKEYIDTLKADGCIPWIAAVRAAGAVCFAVEEVCSSFSIFVCLCLCVRQRVGLIRVSSMIVTESVYVRARARA